MKTWEEAIFSAQKRDRAVSQSLARRDMIAGVAAAVFFGAAAGLVRGIRQVESASGHQPATQQTPVLSEPVP